MPSRVSNLEAYAKRIGKPPQIDTYHTNAFVTICRFPHHTKSIISKNDTGKRPKQCGGRK